MQSFPDFSDLRISRDYNRTRVLTLRSESFQRVQREMPEFPTLRHASGFAALASRRELNLPRPRITVLEVPTVQPPFSDKIVVDQHTYPSKGTMIVEKWYSDVVLQQLGPPARMGPRGSGRCSLFRWVSNTKHLHHSEAGTNLAVPHVSRTLGSRVLVWVCTPPHSARPRANSTASSQPAKREEHARRHRACCCCCCCCCQALCRVLRTVQYSTVRYSTVQ